MDPAEYVRAKRPTELRSERSDHGQISSRKAKTDLGDVEYHLCSATCLHTLDTEFSDVSEVGLRCANECDNSQPKKPKHTIRKTGVLVEPIALGRILRRWQ